mmetsp:Transcript_559/g.1113  ORF Transcript_559/g.1113 Transcript_559/m.1113 type:complete len:114 (-) Transcript_559:375-716(-)
MLTHRLCTARNRIVQLLKQPAALRAIATYFHGQVITSHTFQQFRWRQRPPIDFNDAVMWLDPTDQRIFFDHGNDKSGMQTVRRADKEYQAKFATFLRHMHLLDLWSFYAQLNL